MKYSFKKRKILKKPFPILIIKNFINKINQNKIIKEMLNVIGAESIDQLINETIPEGIRLNKRLNLPRPVSEIEFLNEFQELASRNKIFNSFICLLHN